MIHTKGERALRISSIGLTMFRNYEQLLLHPPEGIIWITGQNAQGKTNLLEALAMSSTGRSHRTRRDRELVRWGEKAASIHVRARHEYAPHDVRMDFFLNEPRRTIVNGEPIARMGDLMGNINTVLFAPEDLRLVKEGPQERRRYMDMALSQAMPTYFFSLQKYQRALRQRNALLRQIKEKPSLRAALEAWEEALIKPAEEIYCARTRFAKRIGEIVMGIHGGIAGGNEKLSIRYRANPEPGERAYADILREALIALREDDIRQGITSAGPHRDDLLLLIGGKDARIYASQGQQRTAALAMKLSQVELLKEQTGEWPVLLLDDVMSELDTARKAALLEWIGGVQTFITAANMEGPPHRDMTVYRVQEGRLLE